MNLNGWSRWGAAALLVGCGGRLVVDRNAPDGPDLGGQAGGGDLGGGSNSGALGQPCAPTRVVTEMEGTFAQADVSIPAHCNAGLNCGSDALCKPIPDCTEPSGVCLVRRSENSGAAGAGETLWDGGEPFRVDGGVLIAHAEPSVQGLAAVGSVVYWAEYGTRDSLGKYQNDGSVMSFDGHQTRSVVSNLPGPIGLGVTTSHAYIYVDGAAPIGSPVHFQLLRVSLSEGEPQLVMDETRPETFASAGDLALWSRAGDGVYQMTSEATAVASVFPASPPLLDLDSYPQLVADATTLFFNGSGVSSVPLAGGTPVSLGLADIPFALYRDFLYGLQAHADVNDVSADTPRGAVLAQAPRKGGAWQSVRALGSGVPFELKIVGDRYFAASFGLNPVATTAPDFCHVRVVTASLGSSAPPILLLDTLLYPPFCPPEYRNFLWAVNASALYWSNDGEAIYSRSLADLP